MRSTPARARHRRHARHRSRHRARARARRLGPRARRRPARRRRRRRRSTSCARTAATCTTCAADVARADDRARARSPAIARAVRRVNALVNNAGRAPRVRADLLEATEESFEELMRTNLQGPYFLTQAIARDMVERRTPDPSFARRASSSSRRCRPRWRRRTAASTASARPAWRWRRGCSRVRLAARRHSGLRGAPRHHRHRHDRRRARDLRPRGSPTAWCPSGAGASPRMSAARWRRWCAATCRTRPAPSCTSTAGSRFRGCSGEISIRGVLSAFISLSWGPTPTTLPALRFARAGGYRRQPAWGTFGL